MKRPPPRSGAPRPVPQPQVGAGPKAAAPASRPRPPTGAASRHPAAPAPSPSLQLFAVATPGLEPALFAQLQALPGAGALALQPGGVEFTGDLATLYRANLWLRSASRVLLRLGELRAVHFASLRRQVAQLPWERFAAAPVRVKVAATAHRCRLYHSGGIAERIALGVADRGLTVLPEEASAAPELHLVARGQDDVFTISLDTSGELLHRRGYRSEDTGAPLRETLAAGLLQLAGWDGTEPLFDPTCGSGTLVIEAALLAARRAPGRDRSFALQSWPSFSPALWEQLLAEADTMERRAAPALLHAADLDPEAVAVARRNAARAGVESAICWSVGDATQAQLPAGPPGLLLCNPPYGVRLGSPQLVRLYKSLGRLTRSAAGWRLGILTSAPQLARAAGLDRPDHTFLSGGLRVSLYLSERAPAAAYGDASMAPYFLKI